MQATIATRLAGAWQVAALDVLGIPLGIPNEFVGDGRLRTPPVVRGP